MTRLVRKKHEIQENRGRSTETYLYEKLYPVKMSFACRYHNFDDNTCNRLKNDCIPGRPGCVLEGRIVISEELEKKLKNLEHKRSSSGKKC